MTPSYTSTHKVEHLEDFTQHEWCNALLSDPSVTNITKRSSPIAPGVSNSLFVETLFTDDAVRACLSLYRPGHGRIEATSDAQLEPSTTTPEHKVEEANGDKEKRLDAQATLHEPETLLLVSLGSAIDGATHRLHGGVTATLLDQVMGALITFSHQSAGATAELNVKYKKAITTPCIVLCRGRIVKEAGRWIETVGWIEDGHGGVFAEGKGSFVKSKVNDVTVKI